MSEALILRSTNPQYDKRLFIDLPVQYMKIPGSNLGEHVVYRNCFWYSEQFMYTLCSELEVFMYWTGKSINNLLSYCGLVDLRISASNKDLPVLRCTDFPPFLCLFSKSGLVCFWEKETQR